MLGSLPIGTIHLTLGSLVRQHGKAFWGTNDQNWHPYRRYLYPIVSVLYKKSKFTWILSIGQVCTNSNPRINNLNCNLHCIMSPSHKRIWRFRHYRLNTLFCLIADTIVSTPYFSKQLISSTSQLLGLKISNVIHKQLIN